MQTLINWTKSPIVVVDENGDRITIPAGQERSVNGNFSRHPWVKEGRLEVTKGKDANDRREGESDDELDMLRSQYTGIFGKKPHSNAGKEKLRKEIDKWRSQQD
ncbi:hypothetical protein ACTVLL_11485 [Serratia nevei]|uniref:hypothetical protein n=1 Tax=Serratia nevei TaxID=2703794 RepID=UPI003FA68299